MLWFKGPVQTLERSSRGSEEPRIPVSALAQSLWFTISSVVVCKTSGMMGDPEVEVDPQPEMMASPVGVAPELGKLIAFTASFRVRGELSSKRAMSLGLTPLQIAKNASLKQRSSLEASIKITLRSQDGRWCGRL